MEGDTEIVKKFGDLCRSLEGFIDDDHVEYDGTRTIVCRVLGKQKISRIAVVRDGKQPILEINRKVLPPEREFISLRMPSEFDIFMRQAPKSDLTIKTGSSRAEFHDEYNARTIVAKIKNGGLQLIFIP